MNAMMVEHSVNAVNNTWEFHSINESDIDWTEIGSEVNRKNPLVCVEVNSNNEKQKFVVIHKTLGQKYFESDAPNEPSGISIEMAETYCVTEIDGLFDDWIKWAKAVKKASRIDGHRKAVVGVFVPVI